MATEQSVLFRATHCPPAESFYAAQMGAGREENCPGPVLNFRCEDHPFRMSFNGVVNNVFTVSIYWKLFRRFDLCCDDRTLECWYSSDSRRALLRPKKDDSYDAGLLPLLIYLEGFSRKDGAFKAERKAMCGYESMLEALTMCAARTSSQLAGGDTRFTPKTTIADTESFLGNLVVATDPTAPLIKKNDWWWQIGRALRYGGEKMILEALRESSFTGPWAVNMAELLGRKGDRTIDVYRLDWSFCKSYAKALSDLGSEESPIGDGAKDLNTQAVITMAMCSIPDQNDPCSRLAMREIRWQLRPIIRRHNDHPVVKAWMEKLRQNGETMTDIG